MSLSLYKQSRGYTVVAVARMISGNYRLQLPAAHVSFTFHLSD